MSKHTFFCIDGHTCGGPVRLVAAGAPPLEGGTQSERRRHFLAEFDWVRTSLMFEPRGHGAMSGAILYPSTREDCDVAVLFIETSGCLPMCGHGTMGTVTFAIEEGLVTPRTPGLLRLDTPAGPVEAHYREEGGKVVAVRIENVPAFLYLRDRAIDVPGLGRLTVDIAYGGNFYPIVEPQAAFRDLADFTAEALVRLGREVQAAVNETLDIVHPEDPDIRGVRHCMWTGEPTRADAQARNAVIYGRTGLDRSPCGTGTCARLAQRRARGLIAPGEAFVHESLLGSTFVGRIEGETRVGDYDAVIPSVEGQAFMTGYNTLIVDDRDPYARGFQIV